MDTSMNPKNHAGHEDVRPTFLDPNLHHVVVEQNVRGSSMAICPSICETGPDTFLVAYHRTTGVDFKGRYAIWLRDSADGGSSWGSPRLMAEGLQAPGLLLLKSGDLLLNGCLHHGDEVASSSTTMKLFCSKDDGLTWSEEAPIWERSKGMRLQGGCGSLVQMKNGRILCPVQGSEGDNYHTRDNDVPGFRAWCYYSDDGGESWTESRVGVELPQRGAMEPSVAETKDGLLVMALRTQLGSVYISRSEDGGETWSEPFASGLEASEAPLAMSCFPDSDRLVLSYCSARYEPEHHHRGERTPLTVATSTDAGESWSRIGDIAGGEHEFGSCGSNSICFASDGRVVFAYNWILVPWNREQGFFGGTNLAIAESSWLS